MPSKHWNQPSSYDENVFCLQRTIAAPLVPALVWTTRIVIEEELIENDVDAASRKRSPKARTRCFCSSSVCR